MGKVVRGLLGIYYQNLTPELAELFGLKKNTKGVIVTDIVEDTAAEKAGIQKGDVIVELNGKPIKKANTFRNNISMIPPGTDTELVVVRNNKRKTITATIGESDELKETLNKLGFNVQDLTDELAEQFGYEGKTGVVVSQVEPGSLAQRRGIKRGILIQEVNRKEIKNTKEFYKEIEKTGYKGNIMLSVKDGRYSRYIVLQLGK